MNVAVTPAPAPAAPAVPAVPAVPDPAVPAVPDPAVPDPAVPAVPAVPDVPMTLLFRHTYELDEDCGGQQTEYGVALIFRGQVLDATAPRDEDRASVRFDDVVTSKLSSFKQVCMDKDGFSWARNHEWWVHVEEYEGDTIHPNEICEGDWHNADEVIWDSPSFVFHEIWIKVVRPLCL